MLPAGDDFPAKQLLQASLPIVALYLLMPQSVHVPPFGPVEPALQVHAVSVGLATGESELVGHAKQVAFSVAPTVSEYVPEEQGEHSDDPCTCLYVPAIHAVHSMPSGPVKPALQIQSEAASLAAGASEFAVHSEHVLSAVAPLAVEYLPAPHSVHASLPLPALYAPASHA